LGYQKYFVSKKDVYTQVKWNNVFMTDFVE